MKVLREEEDAFKVLQSLSKKDAYVVKHVLSAIYTMIMMEMYQENDSVVIPFLGKLTFDYYDRATPKGMETKVDVKLEPSNALISEFSAFSEGIETPGQKYYKKEIIEKLNNALEGDEELRDYLLDYFNLSEEDEESTTTS